MPSTKKAIGYRSSIIASILALILLTLPLLASNYLDKARKGEGKYEFEEEICYDIDEATDFDNTWSVVDGVGALWYGYHVPGGSDYHSKINLLNAPLNNTVDGYGVGSTMPKPGDVPQNVITASDLVRIKLNLTKAEILDLDITRIEFYFDISGQSFTDMDFAILDNSLSKNLYSGKSISIGNVTKIDVSVTDLLTLNTFSDGNIALSFTCPVDQMIIPGQFVIFDMQLYCIKEITTPTLTTLGIYMAFGGLGYIFLGFIVSPEYTMEGTWNTIKKIMEGGKK